MSSTIGMLPQSGVDVFDTIFKCSTILIALFNVCFAIFIFRSKGSDDKKEKERDRKIQLLKTLALDNNLKNLYAVFESIESTLIPAKSKDLTDDIRKTIDKNIEELFINLRITFYDVFIGIDKTLYSEIKTYADELQGGLSSAIFDPGINLSNPPTYSSNLSDKIASTKASIISKLFTYRGE